MTLETVNNIPENALQICRGRSKNDQVQSGRGVFIRTPTFTFRLALCSDLNSSLSKNVLAMLKI